MKKETLKEKLMNQLTMGSIIYVNYVDYEGDSNFATFISLGLNNDKLVCVDDWCEIPYIKKSFINDDLTIFDPEFKKIQIMEIHRPTNIEQIYDRAAFETRKAMTQAEIEQALGYKIKIKE